jgi:hypothetical protein
MQRRLDATAESPNLKFEKFSFRLLRPTTSSGKFQTSERMRSPE